MKTPYEQRQELVLETLNILNTSKLQGQEPTAADIAMLMCGKDDPAIRDWVRKNTSITPAEFTKALRNFRIKEELGCIPQCAKELVDAFVNRDRMYCKFDGELSRNIPPYIDFNDGAGRQYITQEMIDSMPELEMEVRKRFPKFLNLTEFGTELRNFCETFKLTFTKQAIDDALVIWYRQAKRDRKYDLYSEIAGPIMPLPKRDEIEKVWLELARRCFVTDSTVTAEFVVAVLKKFMHQVKRKIWDLDVYDHLMPVILGSQGAGKSTFVMAMLDPILELHKSVDFKMIDEERNIDIWDFYVMFLDEMGHASKANIDMIKNAITTKNLTRRPMTQNTQVTFRQNATFIGCSNKELEQLIKDPTGIRRFVGITFRSDADWAYMNKVDWTKMWQSVEAKGPDPLKPLKATLQKVQEGGREKGKVEEWLTEFNPHRCDDFVQDKQGRVTVGSLFLIYSAWEKTFYPGVPGALGKNEWGNEMKRMWKSGQNTRFEPLGRVGSQSYYKYTGI